MSEPKWSHYHVTAVWTGFETSACLACDRCAKWGYDLTTPDTLSASMDWLMDAARTHESNEHGTK